MNKLALEPLKSTAAELAQLRDVPTRDPHWFRAVDRCRKAALELKRDLDRSLAGLSLPLSAHTQELARQCADIHWQLSQCYTKAALQLAETPGREASASAALLRACYWGIASLGEYLLIKYERYSRIQPGTWQQVHELYSLAVSEGLHQAPLSEVHETGDSDTLARQTVEHAYKRVLLLGLSDPYHQPFRGPTEVYRKLDRWAALAVLTTQSALTDRCRFIVESNVDRPASPALSRSVLRPAFDEKWLETRALVDQLKLEHGKAINTAAKQADRPGAMAAGMESADLIRRLVVHWGLHPIRRTTRTNAYQPCEVVVGLKPVCTALNDFRPLQDHLRGSETASELLQMLRGTFGVRLHAAGDTPVVHHWEIADESDRGCRLVAHKAGPGGRIAIGEVAAVRIDGQWRVGSVHWAQTDDEGALSIGLKKFVMPSETAIIARMGIDGAPGAPGPALLFIDESLDKPAVSLLCPRGQYAPGATYLVHRTRDGREFIVDATNVLMTTRAFCLFEIVKPRADTTRKTLNLIYPHDTKNGLLSRAQRD